MMNEMVISSSAPDNFRRKTLLTSLLQNRIPCKKIGKNPYELLEVIT